MIIEKLEEIISTSCMVVVKVISFEGTEKS
jgi:hypothetical protein